MAIDILKGASSTPLVFLMVQSSDHITALTGASPTVKIGKNGGTGAAPSGAVTEIDSTNLPGWYKVAGNATDTNTAGPLVLHATAASGDPTDILAANIIDPTVAVYGVNTVNIGGQTASASGTVTFPNATLASTTNITAGTITTATNLTNAPTSGDFTATMKTSLNAATPSVTVSDKTGFSLTGAYDPAKTASQAGDAMTLTSAYNFAKGTTTMTESYAAQGAAMTPVQALYQINQHLGESSIVTTTKTVKKRDGSTTAKTFGLNDAVTPTAITEAT